jgi:hypothetical protein
MVVGVGVMGLCAEILSCLARHSRLNISCCVSLCACARACVCVWQVRTNGSGVVLASVLRRCGDVAIRVFCDRRLCSRAHRVDGACRVPQDPTGQEQNKVCTCEAHDRLC